MSLARLLVLALALMCGPALADVSQWSTTPSNNATITDGACGNINWAEGQAPSTVNDSARATMANLRCWYERGGWTPLGHTTAYVGATQFKIAGVDVSAFYSVGTRVRAVGSSTGTIYGRVSVVAFSTDTTVTVQWDSGSLSNEALVVSPGFHRATGQPTPGDFLGAVNTAKAAAVASATATDIWAGAGNFVHVTGTTTITGFGTAPQAGAWRAIVFDDALTLTHGASAIVLPGGANITTAAGDLALVVADTTTKHLVIYQKADGTAVVAPVAYTPNKQIWTATGTFSKSAVTNGATHIIARCWGGGGGGGGGTGGTSRGTGGGGGGYSEERIAVSALATTEDVTIGAGGGGGSAGSPGTAGTAGGASTFGTTPFFTAGGGVGGLAANGTSQAGSVGGTASGGDTNITGGDACVGAGQATSYDVSCGGDAAMAGGTGARSNVAVAGRAPGGGGSNGNHSGGNGGAGAAGRCEAVW